MVTLASMVIDSPQRSQIRALALDLDGTIRSQDGRIGKDLLEQLAGLRSHGVKLILVTGRALLDLADLIDVELFDAVVAENGAILLSGDVQRSLAPEGWSTQRERLVRAFGTTGHEGVIISLGREMKNAVDRTVDWNFRVEFNKDSMMLLPPGVSKGSGLIVALERLGVDARDVMAIGDGENDLAMFRVVGLKVAVRNAVEILMRAADYVTEEESGRGVSEAISRFCGPMSKPKR